MADLAALQTILSGIISGGGSAITAFAATFRNIRKRLNSLEEKVGNDGSDGDPKTGIYLVVERLDELAKRTKKEIDTWEDDPPEWLHRVVNRAARSSSMNLESHAELERAFDQRFRSSTIAVQRLEEQVENLTTRMDGLIKQVSKDYVNRGDFERGGRERVQEMAGIREQLATVNGLLRGIMTAMGFIDEKSAVPGKLPVPGKKL